MNCGNSGMVQRRRHSGLVLEAASELRVARQLRLEDLDSDQATQPGVVSLPDLAHPTDGDAPAQPVPPCEHLPAAQSHKPTTEGIVRGAPAVAEFATRDVVVRLNSVGVQFGDISATRLRNISELLAKRRR
jgi:hypothetical protein